MSVVHDAPITEGIKYAGSKRKLLRQILSLIKPVGAQTVLDGFSGTTRVSQALAQSGYTVVANDIAVWSEVFGRCYLQAKRTLQHDQELIDHLNGVRPRDGWFSQHYGGYENGGVSTQADDCKRPWQIHNTRKLDGIRCEIDRLRLDNADKAVALTSLILALDKVDNGIGHYASYLRRWSPRSYRSLQLVVPNLIENDLDHQVRRGDIFDILDETSVDLAYYDPPYGSNNEKMPPSRVRYQSYYHIWTSVCLNDRPPLFGKSNRRQDSSDRVTGSEFEDFRKDNDGAFIAVNAIDRLISKTSARWIVLSYSSGGRATSEELNDVLQKHGKIVDTLQIDHKKNVMASMTWTNQWLRTAEQSNREFLFLLEK